MSNPLRNAVQQSPLISTQPISTKPLPDFELIETFRYEPCCGFLRVDQHLQRLANSSAELGFAFNEAQIRATLHSYETGDQALRLRLNLAPDGVTTITCTPFQPLPPAYVWKLAIAKTRLSSSDPLLRHKTSRRQLYEAARAEFSPEQADEVLLLNENDELCEGTITSLFVDMGDGTCLTPPLECGLLNGIMREHLLEQGVVKTARITVDDLKKARKIFVGNSLRGMIAAELINQS